MGFATTKGMGPKRAVNVSLTAASVEEAKTLGVSISAAGQAGLDAALKKAREAAWLRDNQHAIDASNAYVEKHGLPLAHLRLW